MKDIILRPTWNIIVIFICPNKNKSAADLPCITITISCNSHNASEMHLPFGTPATNRAEFRDCWVQKFITPILWGHCDVGNAMWVARKKHPEKSIQPWVKIFERKIVRIEQLKKEKKSSCMAPTVGWTAERAQFGAHSSPRQELMNSQAAPPACSSASCKDAHLQSMTQLAVRQEKFSIH